MLLRELARRFLTREVLTFLAVGGAGYVVDVAAFNLLLSLTPFSTLDPTVARTLAVAVAMCVTYAGNRTLTWRDRRAGTDTARWACSSCSTSSASGSPWSPWPSPTTCWA